ncbi:hypothetical protein EOM09_04845 [bacterium]|nr:hypothetical protein [bacterium]
MLVALNKISKEYNLSLEYLMQKSKAYGITKKDNKGRLSIDDKYLKLLTMYYSIAYLRDFLIYWIEYNFTDTELRIELYKQLIRMNYDEVIRFIISKNLMWNLK